MPQIHPMALVEKGAALAADVVVGPFAYIGPNVTLGPGCQVHHHASIEGHTTAGEGNEFFPHSSIGCVSQDLKYRGGNCRVMIGANNRFRENCTVHIGTEDGGGETRIGNDNLLMVGAHVAHDCLVANGCILANNVLLAGHVVLEDGCVISGGAALHHFVTVGQYSFIGGISAVVHDVPPFMMVNGQPAEVRGFNRVGMRRKGCGEDQVNRLKTAWRLLYKDAAPLAQQAQKLVQMYPDAEEIHLLLRFIQRTGEGKFGRYRESLRGKMAPDGEDSGNEN